MNSEIIIRPDEPVNVLQWTGFSIQAKQLASALTVNSPESEISAVDLLKQIKAFFKEAEEVRKLKKEPFFEMGKRIDAAFKPITDSLTEAENVVKAKLNIYLRELEIKRQAEETKRLKEFEEAQAKAVEERAFGDPQIEVAAPVVPEMTLAKTQARGNYGTVSQRSHWTYEIVDVRKIPLDLMIPDEKRIGAMVRGGTRAIPGVRIFEEKIIA